MMWRYTLWYPKAVSICGRRMKFWWVASSSTVVGHYPKMLGVSMP